MKILITGVTGFLGGHIFDYLKKPIVRIGSKEFPIPGSRPLEEQVLPQIHDIEAAIRNLVQ